MISTWLLGRALDWRTWAVIALFAILGTLVYKIDKHGATVQYSKDLKVITALQTQVNANITATKQAKIDALKKEALWSTQISNANKEALDARTLLKTTNDRNTVLTNSLHAVTDTAITRINLPTATSTATIEYTTALSTVFNSCTKEYSDLAAHADGHVIDEKQLIADYPH